MLCVFCHNKQRGSSYNHQGLLSEKAEDHSTRRSDGDSSPGSLIAEVSTTQRMPLKFPELFREKASYKSVIIRSQVTSSWMALQLTICPG